MLTTAGTKIPDTLSAIFAIGALVAAASLTILIIFERLVSSPIRVASQQIKPEVFIVAADTASPTDLSTGRLSPVSADSLTAVSPSKMMPSTGKLSPGRTTNTSPFLSSSTGTVCSAPSIRTLAVFGARRMSDLRASVVLPLLCASSIFPTVISTSIIAADSK